MLSLLHKGGQRCERYLSGGLRHPDGKNPYKKRLPYCAGSPSRQAPISNTLEGAIYVNRALPFGLRSAPKIFTALAYAFEFITKQHGIKWVWYYLMLRCVVFIEAHFTFVVEHIPQ